MNEEEFLAKISHLPPAHQERIKRFAIAYYYLQNKDWKNALKWCQLSDTMFAYEAARRLDKFHQTGDPKDLMP